MNNDLHTEIGLQVTAGANDAKDFAIGYLSLVFSLIALASVISFLFNTYRN